MSMRIKSLLTGNEITFDNVVSIDLELRQNIIDVTLPGSEKPEIMTIGGVDWYMSVMAVLVADEENTVADLLKKISSVFSSGKIGENFLIVIDEWGYEDKCVVESVKIRQVGGEPNKLSVDIRLIIGFVLG